jgi:hypothetical protein
MLLRRHLHFARIDHTYFYENKHGQIHQACPLVQPESRSSQEVALLLQALGQWRSLIHHIVRLEVHYLYEGHHRDALFLQE